MSTPAAAAAMNDHRQYLHCTWASIWTAGLHSRPTFHSPVHLDFHHLPLLNSQSFCPQCESNHLTCGTRVMDLYTHMHVDARCVCVLVRDWEAEVEAGAAISSFIRPYIRLSSESFLFASDFCNRVWHTSLAYTIRDSQFLQALLLRCYPFSSTKRIYRVARQLISLKMLLKFNVLRLNEFLCICAHI